MTKGKSLKYTYSLLKFNNTSCFNSWTALGLAKSMFSHRFKDSFEDKKILLRTNLGPINPVYYIKTEINQSFQIIINDKYRINLSKDNFVFIIYSLDVGNKALVT